MENNKSNISSNNFEIHKNQPDAEETKSSSEISELSAQVNDENSEVKTEENITCAQKTHCNDAENETPDTPDNNDLNKDANDNSDVGKNETAKESDNQGKNTCFAKDNEDIMQNTDKKTKKGKKRWGMCILLILPYLFICAGIALFSVFLFKEYIETSTIWRLAINVNAVTPPTDNEGEEFFDNGEVIGGTIDDISLEPVSRPETSESEESGDAPTESTDIAEQIYYNKNEFPGYKWGELWATLSIPEIGLEEKNVYVGESNSIYKKGIGKRYGTRFPGQGGNIVLGAHVTREFYDLSELEVGDRVYLETEYGSYVYEIYETVIFSIEDVKYVMNYDDGEKLTLYTCHPRGTAYRTERYGVICKKISGPEWVEIN